MTDRPPPDPSDNAPATVELDDPAEARNAGADFALIASVAVTVALYQLPNARTFAWPLVLLSTLAHEMGHGLTALLVGGQFQSFLINEDASGLASTVTESHLQGALVAAGGLVGPACASALLFVLARRDRLARATLVLLAVALGVTIPTLLVGIYGKTFVACVALVCLTIATGAPAWVARYALAFVAVQLALSVYSRGDYLFTPVAHMATGDMPSDVAHMAEHLGLAYWFWGGVCAAFSAVALLVGARLFLRGFGRKRSRTRVAAGAQASLKSTAVGAEATRSVPGSPHAEIEKMLQRLKQPDRG